MYYELRSDCSKDRSGYILFAIYISIVYLFKFIWLLADDSIKQRGLSAKYICCIYSILPKTNLIM